MSLEVVGERWNHRFSTIVIMGIANSMPVLALNMIEKIGMGMKSSEKVSAS